MMSIWTGFEEAADHHGWTAEQLEALKAIDIPTQTIIDHTPTLRDQFAMAALTGLLSTGGRVDDETVREAYLAASLMLAAREAK